MSLSDNASNGSRGQRAALTPALAAFVSRQYGFDANTKYADLGGSSCLNLRADTREGRYVIRVYRRYVTPRRLEDIGRVKAILSDNGIPCPAPLQAASGHNWAVWEDRLVEAERFVRHDSVMD